tara:strand:- start:247 stop:501 length:255 start_codon:yes stop_codon:yes gene_type:complete
VKVQVLSATLWAISSAVERLPYKEDVTSSILVSPIMKDKKLKKLIQKPLRFHHQDIHEELDEIKEMLKNVISEMQTMQQRIDKQ